MDQDDRILAYLQNRLDADDRVDFEFEMSRRPELRAEVTSLRAAAADLGQRPVPGNIKAEGWDRLSAAIDAERVPGAANTNHGLSMLKVAAIVAASVLLWQFAVVPRISGPGDGFVTASDTLDGPALRVAFADAATLAEITALLQQARATVTGGPGALGLYTLEFASDTDRAAAQSLLEAAPDLVTTVTTP